METREALHERVRREQIKWRSALSRKLDTLSPFAVPLLLSTLREKSFPGSMDRKANAGARPLLPPVGHRGENLLEPGMLPDARQERISA